MARNKGLQLALWIVGGTLAFINNQMEISFGLMLSIITAPLGMAAGTRLASPKKKRRLRR